MSKQNRKKGFIFTMDAIAALGIIIVLAVTWSIAVRAKAGDKYFVYMEKIARDEGIVSIYTHSLHSDDFNALNANTVCERYFTLQPNNTTAQTDVNVSILCVDTTAVFK